MAAPAQRLIVKFRPTLGPDSPTIRQLCDRVAAMTGGTLERLPSPTGRAVFRVPASVRLDPLIRQIEQLPSVEYAERDVTDRAMNR
jgi:hypothetical protein